MTENHEMQKTPSMSAPSTEPSKVESQDDTRMSRRKALLGALFAGAAITSKTAEASDANCSCLPAPDCNAVCPNGGSPRGDGTQACDCFENPPMPTLHPVAYSGDYNSLANRPNRAGSDSDGGDARNSIMWNGHTLRKNYNNNASQIPVFSGSYVDFINRSDLVGNVTLPNIGAKTYTVTSGEGYRLTVERDAYGRVANVTSRYVNCNCCNCGDDSNCFIKAKLRTLEGFKSVDEISVGDKLVGIDGVSTVVSVVTGKLGARKAIVPLGVRDLILTEEHIVLFDGCPTIYCESGIERGKKVIESPCGIKGVYLKSWLEKMVKVNQSAFETFDCSQETITYTFIVDKGCWGLTEEGISVLLCEEIKG